MKTVEAGAQGDHKLARGYMPTTVYSLHWFLNKGFSDAVKIYLEEERTLIRNQKEHNLNESPFKLK